LNQKSGRTGDLRPNKPEQPDLDELTGVLGAEAELNSGWWEQRHRRSVALSATAAAGADFWQSSGSAKLSLAADCAGRDPVPGRGRRDPLYPWKTAADGGEGERET
jgi:hypothetical protein